MKKNYFAIAVVAMMFASCSQNDEIVPKDSLKDTPITVTAGVAELNSRAGYETPKEGETGEPVLPETFYLSIDQDETSYDYTDVVMTKGTGNAYTPASQLLWAGDKAVKVTAATFSLTGAQTLEVKTDQSTNENVCLSDHLYMTDDNVTPSSEGISVAFNHIMSKILLTITLNNEFKNETENPIDNVTFMGTVASNSYNAGTWATFSTDATATDIIAWEDTYADGVAHYEVILVPQTVAVNGFKVQFTIGDRTFQWTSTDAVILASGTQYELALNMTDKSDENVSSATLTAKAWGGSDNSTPLEAN